MLKGLRRLREDLEKDGANLAETEAPVLLVLADVCDALGFNAAVKKVVLGVENMEKVEEWQGARLYRMPSALPRVGEDKPLPCPDESMALFRDDVDPPRVIWRAL